MKVIKLVALAVLLLLALGLLARNQLIKMEARRLLAEQTGFGLEIGRLKTHLWSSRADLFDVVVRNPPDFPEPIAFVVQRAHVDIDPWALLRRETHLKAMELEIPRVVIVRNIAGDTNLQRLSGKPPRASGSASSRGGAPAPAGESPPRGGQAAPAEPDGEKAGSKSERPFRIDRLRIRIDTVEYHDYRGGGDPAITTLDIKVDREHADVTSTRQIGDLLVAGVMESAAERLFGDLGRSIQAVVEDEQLRSEIKKFGRDLKRVFKGLMEEAAQE